MLNEFTEICQTQYEYSVDTNLATTTKSCYRPLDVYHAYLIDALFFIIPFIIFYLFIHHRK